MLPNSSMAHDLLAFPLRAFYRVETFAFSTVPRNLIRMSGLEDMAMRVWGADLFAEVPSQGAADAAAAAAAGDATTAGPAPGAEDGFNFGDIFDTVRKFGGFFSYIASRWSYTCFVVVRFFSLFSSTCYRG